MSFYARVVPAPPELSAHGHIPVDAAGLDAPQLPTLAPNARAALVFVETSAKPVLPHELLRDGGDAAAAERLYWQLVSTDSCEAVHTGALLTLRALVGHGLAVRDDAHADRSPIVEFGMVNAVRLAPFTRHIMVPLAGTTVEVPRTTTTTPTTTRTLPPPHASPASASTHARPRANGRASKARVRFAEAPRDAAHGGAMHQLVWCRTASGRELVFDLTGPQVRACLPLALSGMPLDGLSITS